MCSTSFVYLNYMMPDALFYNPSSTPPLQDGFAPPLSTDAAQDEEQDEY